MTEIKSNKIIKKNLHVEMAIAMQIRETQQIFIIPLPHPPCCVLCAFPFSPTTTTPTTREILFCISALSRSLGGREISMICMQIRLVTRIIKCFTHIYTVNLRIWLCHIGIKWTFKFKQRQLCLQIADIMLCVCRDSRF